MRRLEAQRAWAFEDFHVQWRWSVDELEVFWLPARHHFDVYCHPDAAVGLRSVAGGS